MSLDYSAQQAMYNMITPYTVRQAQYGEQVVPPDVPSKGVKSTKFVTSPDSPTPNYTALQQRMSLLGTGRGGVLSTAADPSNPNTQEGNAMQEMDKNSQLPTNYSPATGNYGGPMNGKKAAPVNVYQTGIRSKRLNPLGVPAPVINHAQENQVYIANQFPAQTTPQTQYRQMEFNPGFNKNI